jgi:transcriptional regulator with XRE-family HTH domain
MLTAEQIRAGRALLGWSATELADRASLHITTVRRLERSNGSVSGTIESLRRIEDTLLAAGVEFIASNGRVGVQLLHQTHRNGHT